MSFHPITVSGKTWHEAGPGRYMDSTVTFGSPLNYIQISGGKRSVKSGITTVAVSRVLQKDIPLPTGSSQRKSASVQLVIQVPDGFTTSELDGMADTISSFLTVPTLERLLQGDQ